MNIIGWREWVHLPRLTSVPIKAKVDTGAKTSALHAFFIEPYTVDGVRHVKFLLHPYQNDNDTVVECHAPIIDERIVRDSGGHAELRFVIASTFVLGSQSFDGEITLTDRDSMVFRMLLGRNVLKRRFLVNSSASFQLGGSRNTPPARGE
jgi:hypothetical protein